MASPRAECDGWTTPPRLDVVGALRPRRILRWGASLRLVCGCGHVCLTITEAHPARLERSAERNRFRVTCPCGAELRLRPTAPGLPPKAVALTRSEYRAELERLRGGRAKLSDAQIEALARRAPVRPLTEHDE